MMVRFWELSPSIKFVVLTIILVVVNAITTSREILTIFSCFNKCNIAYVRYIFTVKPIRVAPRVLGVLGII